MSLEEYILVFKEKWLRRKEEYNGDINKLYLENKKELFEDMMVLWEKAFLADVGWAFDKVIE